jgi:hypothetical protein
VVTEEDLLVVQSETQAEYFSANDSPSLFPLHGGRRVSVPTVWRWMLYGVRGAKLRSVLIGGRRFTTRQWAERFIADVTAARDRRPQQVVQQPAATPVDPGRHCEVSAQLDALGL